MTPFNRMPVRGMAPKTDEFKSVRSAIILMNELAAALNEEAALVRDRKFPQQKDVIRRKQRLAMDYRASMKAFAMQPEALKTLPQDLRNAVKAAAQKLADAADQNARLLRTAILATQRLLQSVITIVKDEKLPKSGYNDTRKGHMKLGTYSPTCKPVTVTRTA